MAVQGTWNIGGFNLPDYGITEGIRDLMGKTASPEVETAFNNPRVIQQNLGYDKAPTSTGGGGSWTDTQKTNNIQNTQQKSSGPTAPSKMNDADLNAWAIAHGYTGTSDYNDKMREKASQGPDYAALDREAENLYNTGINMYDQQAGFLGDQRVRDETDIANQVEGRRKEAMTQQDELLGSTDADKNEFLGVIQSAIEQATRQFNAMKQQASSKFGMGNSVGQAMGELAQQEFFRQQGDVNGKMTKGLGDFEVEKGKIRTFVAKKIADLDSYKDQAMNSLKTNYENMITQINLKKGELAANKSRDKMNIMQQTIAYAQNIADRDQQIRAGIASSAIQSMQEAAGRAFTPTEIKAVLSEFGITMPGVSETSSAAVAAKYRNPYSKTEDEFGNLTG